MGAGKNNRPAYQVVLLTFAGTFLLFFILGALQGLAERERIREDLIQNRIGENLLVNFSSAPVLLSYRCNDTSFFTYSIDSKSWEVSSEALQARSLDSWEHYSQFATYDPMLKAFIGGASAGITFRSLGVARKEPGGNFGVAATIAGMLSGFTVGRYTATRVSVPCDSPDVIHYLERPDSWSALEADLKAGLVGQWNQLLGDRVEFDNHAESRFSPYLPRRARPPSIERDVILPTAACQLLERVTSSDSMLTSADAILLYRSGEIVHRVPLAPSSDWLAEDFRHQRVSPELSPEVGNGTGGNVNRLVELNEVIASTLGQLGLGACLAREIKEDWARSTALARSGFQPDPSSVTTMADYGAFPRCVETEQTFGVFQRMGLDVTDHPLHKDWQKHFAAALATHHWSLVTTDMCSDHTSHGRAVVSDGGGQYVVEAWFESEEVARPGRALSCFCVGSTALPPDSVLFSAAANPTLKELLDSLFGDPRGGREAPPESSRAWREVD